MSPAATPRRRREDVRLLHVAADRAVTDHEFLALPTLLERNDLLVVNDAATLPASLHGTTADGRHIEVRLLGPVAAVCSAVLFGAGNWRQRTEDRPPPPKLEVGDVLSLGATNSPMEAQIVSVDARSPRLLRVRFKARGADLLAAIYAHGRPVQYAHVHRPLDLWDVQTVYASRPWAAEMPSAGRPLTLPMLARLRERGVRVAALTHAAGLSATGDLVLDAALPLPERYEIPEATAAAVNDTRRRGGRVVAVGTTVVRALEASAIAGAGHVGAGQGVATIVIDPAFTPQVVHGVLSGIHDEAESHYRLLGAFARRVQLEAALRHARREGYRTHEFGDTCLVVRAA